MIIKTPHFGVTREEYKKIKYAATFSLLLGGGLRLQTYGRWYFLLIA
jgi:hypothetical protein